MKYPTFALVSLFSINFVLISAGSSYCNNGPCDLNIDCSLGFCCNNTCTNSQILLIRGANCDPSDICFHCPAGQSCQGGKCTDVLYRPARDLGCNCADNADCITQLCLSGKCASSQLYVRDYCVQDIQCLSNKCFNGVCSGGAEGEACVNYYCNPGLICNNNNICSEGSIVGEACDDFNNECTQYLAKCVNGVCIDPFSTPAGGNCTSEEDCVPGLACQLESQDKSKGICAALYSCSAGQRCADHHTCVCDGKGTKCKKTSNYCPAENNAFVACMRANNCSDVFYLRDPSRCNWAHCSAEILSLECCQRCGGDSDSLPSNGVDCSGPTPVYAPTLYCGTGSYSRPPGKCGATNAGPVDDSSNNTIPMFSSFSLIALMLIMSAFLLQIDR